MSSRCTSTKGRQERRGPHTASALPGRSAAARASSLHRVRRGAAELAGHRRRLLDLADAALSFPPERPVDFPGPPLFGAPGSELDPTDALLLRVEPVALEPLPAYLARLAAAALAGGGQGVTIEIEGHTALKAAASQSRPPASRNLRPTDVNSPGSRFAAREGEGSTPSTHQASSPARGENAVEPLQER